MSCPARPCACHLATALTVMIIASQISINVRRAGVRPAAATAVSALRASIAFGERRSRFASAVTHELRTPLTTFRMYSEMLADDMVPDEGQRRVYLATLKEESGRLATLVENVLTYARLEEGRFARRGLDDTPADTQLTLFEPVGHELVEELRDLDPETMTPLQALERLITWLQRRSASNDEARRVLEALQ